MNDGDPESDKAKSVRQPAVADDYIRIRKEKLPERCDICHQSDEFDPETGHCRRCANVALSSPATQQVTAPTRDMGNLVRERTSAQWKLFAICLSLAFGSIVYRLLVLGHLEQTSLLFIGVPALLAGLLALRPKAKSSLGMIIKGLTISLLMSSILLGEGFICIVMASPIFYLVGLIIGLFVDKYKQNHSTDEKRKYYQQGLFIMIFLAMSLEGVTDRLSFPRYETVSVERVIAASPEEIEESLSQAPSFTTELPLYLKMGFPRPVQSSGSGLALGDRRTIHFAGGEGNPGDLVLEVLVREHNMVKFRAIGDSSKIAHWLAWKESEVNWTRLESGQTKVKWTLHYRRDLDPAWYFGPWERYAVGLAANYLIDNLAMPDHLK
jgi:hypothetical protein